MRTLLLLVSSLCLGSCYLSHTPDDAAAPDRAPADLCTGTGGHLGVNCGPWHCTPSPLDCIETECICPGSIMIFDPTRGCITSSMCGVHGG